MTNEAIKVELTNSTGFPRRYTCATNAEIPKGSILTLSDPRTAAVVSGTPNGNGYKPAGIASASNANGDGTYAGYISAWTNGVFELKASGSITVGCPVKSCGTNFVMAAVAADVASGAIMGYALETAADDEAINVRVTL